MGHVQQYIIDHKEKDHRLLLKRIGMISLMFILIVLLMTYTFSFFDFISMKQGSFEEGYHWVPSEAPQTQMISDNLEHKFEKSPLQALEEKGGLSVQEKNVLVSYMLFGKALRGFKSDGKIDEVKNNQN